MFYIRRMEPLTKAQEKVLQIIWQKEPTYLKDILEAFEEPRPAKTTIATLIKKTIDKGYVAYETKGSIREYRSLVTKSSFLQKKMRNLIGSFFNNNTSQFASFFAQEMDLSNEEIVEIKKIYSSLEKEEK
ncbi:MAG: BlaI family penicillinase repressor [Saprospiraceae bacterium]|jgi:BlaI family penicillinase repressor